MDNERFPMAVAISYDPQSPTPVIAASGRGLLADKIIKIATDNDVPISSDPNVVEALIQIPIGDEIPEIMFQVVAIILAPILLSDQTNV